MFEKEAEERARKLEESQTLGVYDNDEDLARDSGWNDGEVAGYEKGFQEGSEFGYNKANEWHYVKDGLPTKDGRYLICNIFSNNHVATNIAEFNSSNRIFGCIDNSTIYAWKEIVLPELKESK